MDWKPPRFHNAHVGPVRQFQVLGERNSGTNFVASLLRANLSGDIVEGRPYGWKHGFIDRRVVETPDLLTVVVYRHPVRWLQSVHAKPLELTDNFKGLSFEAFLKTPWTGGFQKPGGAKEPSTADLEPQTGRVFPDPMAARRAKISYLEEMQQMAGRVAFLRFEDANRDPKRTLERLCAIFDLPRGPYRPVSGFKGTGGRYLPKHIRPPSSAHMAHISARLDHALEARLGYDLNDIPAFDGLSPWDRRSLKSRFRDLWRSAQAGGRPKA